LTSMSLDAPEPNQRSCSFVESEQDLPHAA
jgi:hypothetical protein